MIDAPASAAVTTGTGLRVETVRSLDRLAHRLPEWLAAWERSGDPNPFVHPAWTLTWARHFTTPGELEVSFLLRGEEIVAVAPFYRRRLVPGHLPRTGILRLLGAGRRSHLTELPGLLVTGDARRMARTVVEHLQGSEPAPLWLELTLGPEHGWLDPAWLRAEGGPATHFGLLKGSRACVVLPLHGDGEAVLRGLKRNVRESIRRGRNRLAKEGVSWSVERVTGAGVGDAVTTVIGLNRARAELATAVRHRGATGDAQDAAFIREAVGRLGERGAATVYLLVIDGVPRAGEVILHGRASSYVSTTGIDPSAWHLSPLAVVRREVILDACARGDTSLNLSTGPDQAKLRWSEDLVYHHDFIVADLHPATAAALSGYQASRTAVFSFHERARWLSRGRAG